MTPTETSFVGGGPIRFSSDIFCDPYKYEIDVEAGVVVSHGPAAPMEGALPMELPTVSRVAIRCQYRNGFILRVRKKYRPMGRSFRVAHVAGGCMCSLCADRPRRWQALATQREKDPRRQAPSTCGLPTVVSWCCAIGTGWVLNLWSRPPPPRLPAPVVRKIKTPCQTCRSHDRLDLRNHRWTCATWASRVGTCTRMPWSGMLVPSTAFSAAISRGRVGLLGRHT